MLRASDNAEPETEPGETGAALIAARPGRMRESLQALLAAMPRTSAVRVTGDGAAALEDMASKQPSLLVLDTNLPDRSAWRVLRQVKSRWPEARCLVLVESVGERETAEAAGADGVLVRGFSTAELYVVVEDSLAGDTGEPSPGAQAGREAHSSAVDSARALDGGAA